MDFDVEYTAAQRAFRDEVSTWLDEELEPLSIEHDEHVESLESYLARRELGRALGRRGWLYPMSPKEYGGGGLDLDSAIMIMEALQRRGLGLPPYYDSGGVLSSAAILSWGTEEQKGRLLPPIYTGAQRTWQLLTEPSAGSDLAAASTTAVRAGDAYLVTGQKVYIGSLHGAEALWTIVRTGAPEDRHKNLSWLMIDARLPGITIAPQRIIGGIEKNTVFFDEVAVPVENLVGGENRGWEVAFTHLDHEHGLRSDRQLGRWLTEAWEATVRVVRGRDPALDPLLREDQLDTLAEIYVRKEVVRLIGVRNYWLAMTGRARTYEGSQGYYLEKKTTQWLAQALADVFGPAAMSQLDAGDAAARLLASQALGALSMHGGGTGEIQKMLIARKLGLGGASRG
jgi:alkylation response protein AidB-like acyl-CoA dehydrogenase